MIRIVVVGLGPLGVRIAADATARGFQVVAGVDPDPRAAARVSFPVVPRIDAIADWESIDAAVVSTVSDLAACAPTLRELLERGVSAVSTCEELSFPWLRHAELAAELDDLAKARGGRLLGTGVNPGFLMDAFPLFATTVCQRVDRIEVHRIQDASSRRIPFQRKIGAGLTPAEFEAQVAAGTLRHVGLGESLHFLARYVGLPIERWDETIEPVLGDDGRCRGVKQVGRAYRGAGSDTSIELLFIAAIGEPDPHDRVIVAGEPPLDVIWRGGVHGDIATSAVVLASIPRLLFARAGLHTMATIPMAG